MYPKTTLSRLEMDTKIYFLMSCLLSCCLRAMYTTPFLSPMKGLHLLAKLITSANLKWQNTTVRSSHCWQRIMYNPSVVLMVTLSECGPGRAGRRRLFRLYSGSIFLVYSNSQRYPLNEVHSRLVSLLQRLPISC